MEIFSLIQLLGVLIGIGFLVYEYAQPSVKIHIKALTYFSWLLSFGFVFLVPLDIYYTFFIFKDPNLLEETSETRILEQNNKNFTENLQSQDFRINFFDQNQDQKEQTNTQEISRYLQEGENNQEQLPNQDEEQQDNNKVDEKDDNLNQENENLDKDIKFYNSLEVIWKVIWWICFFMTWIILPFFQEYEDVGDFTIAQKTKTSISNNLKLYALMVIGGAAFIIYLLASGTLTTTSLGGFAVLMVNCFGLLLVVLLLGHGLVALPKKYWLQKNLEVMLKYNYFQAATIDNDMQEAQYSLEDEVKVLQATIQKNQEFPHINQLQEILDLVPREIKKAATESRNKPNVSGNQDDKKLAKLHREMKNRLANYNRLSAKFESNLMDAIKTEDIIKARNSPQEKIKSVFWGTKEGALGQQLDKIQWIWYTKLKKYYYILLFIVFTASSILILLGELAIFIQQDLSIFEYLLYNHQSYFPVMVFSLAPLLYITFCVYYGLFHMKVQGFFGFYKGQHTDATSLMFGSINFTRVSAPICYNFLQMIKVNRTAFNSVMGQMDVFPIVFTIFPIILIILSCFNAFDIYKKVLGIFGFTQFQFSEDFNDEGIEDGKKIISRARIVKERQFMEYSQKHKLSFGFNSEMKSSKKSQSKDNSTELKNGRNTLNSSLTSHSSNSTQGEHQQQLPPTNYNNFNFRNNQNLNDILNI